MIAKKKLIKNILHIAGSLLAVAGIIFLFANIEWEKFFISVKNFGVVNLFSISFFYAVLTAFLFLAWKSRLSTEDKKIISGDHFRYIYARSVGAKYLPGNIFQFASRQIDLSRYGVSQPRILMTSVDEIISQALTAFLVIFIFDVTSNTLEHVIWAHFQEFLPGQTNNIEIWRVIDIAIVSASLFGIWKRKLFSAVFWHILFFIGMELIAQFLWTNLVPGNNFPSLPYGVVTLSWLIGFVTVGAPAGIGVREAIIIISCQTLLGSSGADVGAVLAFSLRFVTIMGDLLFIMVSFTIYHFKSKP
ncbi:MAG: hypothetical protein HOJ06_08095 [Rhodospirillaceae bacterium]|nr:hypothetical protein [Rhodospirillaceae bacterium]